MRRYGLLFSLQTSISILAQRKKICKKFRSLDLIKRSEYNKGRETSHQTHAALPLQSQHLDIKPKVEDRFSPPQNTPI